MAYKGAQKDLFASPEDLIKAHQIVEDSLGAEFDITYLEFPLNKGLMGDEGVRGHSLMISAASSLAIRAIIEGDYEQLEQASNRLCNETGAASKVMIDITPLSGQPNP
jgi:hypothetical protein